MLSIFLGWTGAQNFYAKNKRKGWVSVVTLFLWLSVIYLSTKSKFFASIATSIGGGSGFICVFIWVSDIINVITNQFRYRVQIDKFISSMNVETRAKLGEKYIDLELYHKPWWFRFKVWCQKLKRNYHEIQRDRRQRNIDKQKRKLAELEEKNRIEQEISEYEEKQERKNSDIVNQNVLNELSAFSDDEETKDINDVINNEDNQNQQDIDDEEKSSNEGDNSQNFEIVVEEKRERKVGNLQKNKYAKFSNSKSSKKNKKK